MMDCDMLPSVGDASIAVMSGQHVCEHRHHPPLQHLHSTAAAASIEAQPLPRMDSHRQNEQHRLVFTTATVVSSHAEPSTAQPPVSVVVDAHHCPQKEEEGPTPTRTGRNSRRALAISPTPSQSPASTTADPAAAAGAIGASVPEVTNQQFSIGNTLFGVVHFLRRAQSTPKDSSFSANSSLAQAPAWLPNTMNASSRLGTAIANAGSGTAVPSPTPQAPQTPQTPAFAFLVHLADAKQLSVKVPSATSMTRVEERFVLEARRRWPLTALNLPATGPAQPSAADDASSSLTSSAANGGPALQVLVPIAFFRQEKRVRNRTILSRHIVMPVFPCTVEALHPMDTAHQCTQTGTHWDDDYSHRSNEHEKIHEEETREGVVGGKAGTPLDGLIGSYFCAHSPSCTGLRNLSHTPGHRGIVADRQVIAAIAFHVVRGLRQLHSGFVFTPDLPPTALAAGETCVGFTHNDVRLPNLLLDSDTGNVVLCDTELVDYIVVCRATGCLRIAGHEEKVNKKVVNMCPHDTAKDAFMLGILVCTLLTGCEQFVGHDSASCAPPVGAVWAAIRDRLCHVLQARALPAPDAPLVAFLERCFSPQDRPSGPLASASSAHGGASPLCSPSQPPLTSSASLAASGLFTESDEFHAYFLENIPTPSSAGPSPSSSNDADGGLTPVRNTEEATGISSSIINSSGAEAGNLAVLLEAQRVIKRYFLLTEERMKVKQ